MTFVHELSRFSRYPMNIYKAIYRIIAIIIPYAFTSYFPISCLLGKTNIIFRVICPGIGLFFFMFAYVLWNKGIKRYGSAGG